VVTGRPPLSCELSLGRARKRRESHIVARRRTSARVGAACNATIRVGSHPNVFVAAQAGDPSAPRCVIAAVRFVPRYDTMHRACDPTRGRDANPRAPPGPAMSVCPGGRLCDRRRPHRGGPLGLAGCGIRTGWQPMRPGSIERQHGVLALRRIRREVAPPLNYRKRGSTIDLSFWRAPERLFDQPDELVSWARTALEAARRVARNRGRVAPTKKSKPKPASRQP
jgi:hypothetical protein